MITEPRMLALVMSGIRGGLSFIGLKRIVDTCPQHNPDKHTIYIDAKNLVSHIAVKTLVSEHLNVIIDSFLQYRYCQTFRLPCGNFKYLENPEITSREAINSYIPDCSTRYFLEVDLVGIAIKRWTYRWSLIISSNFKKMKKRPKCVRQFTYLLEEMKNLKGTYLFTIITFQHKMAPAGNRFCRDRFVNVFPCSKYIEFQLLGYEIP